MYTSFRVKHRNTYLYFHTPTGLVTWKGALLGQCSGQEDIYMVSVSKTGPTYRVSEGQRLSQVSAHSRTHAEVNDQQKDLFVEDLDREPIYRVRNEYRGSSSGSLIRNDTHLQG